MHRWRDDFPILTKQMNGQPLAYLDTGSSAQKPQIVLDAMRDVYENSYANIHRGIYAFSQETTSAYEAVRAKVANFIGAVSEREIVFTRNTTEAINLVTQSYGRTYFKQGDEIILTEMEHHANIVPWQLLRDQTGVVIKVIPVLDDGTLDLKMLSDLISERTVMISFTHISNALGTINPIKEIVSNIKEINNNIKVLVDGSQGVVHEAVQVQDIGCDFYVFTGHKLYGPNGIGVLWGRAEILSNMPPYQGGGDMIDRVTFKETMYQAPPQRFEAGTPPIVEVIGLGAAIDYIMSIGIDAIKAHEQSLTNKLYNFLDNLEGITLYGPKNRAGIFSFNLNGVHHHDVGAILDQCGVAVRTGHHCCQPLMQRFNIEGTIRASLGLYSNDDDLEQLMDGLTKAKSMLL